MRKYAQITPEQVGYGLGGAAGGAALGYLASHLLNRKASTGQRLLYTLLGAAGGAGVSGYALSRMHRAPAVAPEEIEEAAVVEEPVVPGSPWRSKAAIGGAITGGIAGDIVGSVRSARNYLREYKKYQGELDQYNKDLSGLQGAQEKYKRLIDMADPTLAKVNKELADITAVRDAALDAGRKEGEAWVNRRGQDKPPWDEWLPEYRKLVSDKADEAVYEASRRPKKERPKSNRYFRQKAWVNLKTDPSLRQTIVDARQKTIRDQYADKIDLLKARQNEFSTSKAKAEAGLKNVNAAMDPISNKIKDVEASQEALKKRGPSRRLPIVYGAGGALLGYGLGAGASYFGRKYGTPR